MGLSEKELGAAQLTDSFTNANIWFDPNGIKWVCRRSGNIMNHPRFVNGFATLLRVDQALSRKETIFLGSEVWDSVGWCLHTGSSERGGGLHSQGSATGDSA